tara:strand:- start:1247 stop:1465 length:219 start_codon:yes stop_codon:yes gene_type:complete
LTSVRVDKGRFEQALRRWKRKVDATGKMQEVRERQFYTKKSDKLRKKKAAGTIRCKQKQRKAGLPPEPKWLR